MTEPENPFVFEKRKKDHIKWSLDERSQSRGVFFEKYKLIHDALPEIDFDEISLKSTSRLFPDKKPFLVSSMTGGHKESYKINETLLEACKKTDWIFSTGSLRKELENLRDTNFKSEWTLLTQKNQAPIVGNIGISHVISYSTQDLVDLIEEYNLKGLFVHLNPLQEALQREGTRNFKKGLESLEELTQAVHIPVFLKETGTGFSRKTFAKVKGLKLSAIDVSGLGGTHWGRIESLRGDEKSQQAFEAFSNWGISTLDSLCIGKKVLDSSITELWSSGGLRNGVDFALSFALGAKVCGVAKPLLEAALKGVSNTIQVMEQFEYELKVAMFCTGSKNVEELDETKVMFYGNEL